MPVHAHVAANEWPVVEVHEHIRLSDMTPAFGKHDLAQQVICRTSYEYPAGL